MWRRWGVILGCMVVLFAGCARVGVETISGNVGILADRHTYGWLEPDRENEDSRVYNPEVDSVVRKTVDKSLAGLGYTQVAQNKNPDFLISWFGGIEKKIKVETIDHFYANHGYGAMASMMPKQVAEGATTREFVQGTIMIDILDPQSHQLIWRGTGSDRLRQGMNKEDAALYIKRVVTAIFKELPPANPRK